MTKGWGRFEPKGGEIFASPSRLILFRESPLLYKAKYIDKVVEDTPSMDFGTLVHKTVLEPESFEKEYLVLPEKTKENDLDSKQLEALCKELGLKVSGTKAEKVLRIREALPDFPKQYDELLAEIPKDLKVVPPKQVESAKLIAERISNHKQVGTWIKLAEKEKRGFFEFDGVIIRFQIDAFFEHKGAAVLTELKITKDWDSRNFEYNLFKNGFHIQLAIYREALKAIEGKEINAFLIVAVEPKLPHRIRFHQLDIAAIDAGLTEFKHYLKEYKKALQENDFSERPETQEINIVSLKQWDWDRISNIEVSDE